MKTPHLPIHQSTKAGRRPLLGSICALVVLTAVSFAQTPPPAGGAQPPPPPQNGTQPQNPPVGGNPPALPPVTQPPTPPAGGNPPTQPPTPPPVTQPPAPPTGGNPPPTQPPVTLPVTQPPTTPPATPTPGPISNRPHRPQPKRQTMQPPTGAPRPGDPLRGLTADQLSDFATGRVEFRNRETPATGLGPIFNDVSCFACHSHPVAGGNSAQFVIRFGETTNGVFDPLTDLGGSLLQKRSITPALREIVPPEANVTTRRVTPPLWGLGLIDAIPDATIQALAARPVVDGIVGHVALITDVDSTEPHVGRFGWKNQHTSLLAFCADAYANEMGVTNHFFPIQNAPNGKTDLLTPLHLSTEPEDQPDPVLGKADFELVSDFLRLLAPLPRPASTMASVPGQAVFTQIGCAVCHVPSMQTGASDIAAIANKPVPLYSDLLLHDMGSLGDGIEQGAAMASEFRTMPLWGVREGSPYLHDGRAQTIDQAIRMHEGQGAVSRNRYLKLTDAQRQQLLAFLNTL